MFINAKLHTLLEVILYMHIHINICKYSCISVYSYIFST